MHSIVPPSSAHIYGAPNGCTGWVLLAQQYPETEDGQDALEGSAAHEIAEQLVSYSSRGVTTTTHDEFTGEIAKNGIVFNEEMFDAAKIYANEITKVMRKEAVFGEGMLNEYSLKIPMFHELSHGTIDCAIFGNDRLNLYLYDFKYGHEVVEVFENWQMLSYLAGLVDHFKITGYEDQRVNVHINVIQPRAYHRDGVTRTWTTKLSNLRGYFNILKSNIETSLSEKAELRTGPHCKHCQCRHVCKPALECGLSLYEMVNKPIPQDLTPLALGVQLGIVQRARKQLEYLESGLIAQVESTIKSGQSVPGWIFEQGYGRKIWVESMENVLALGETYKTNLLKQPELVTPTQALKLGIDEMVINVYTSKPKRGIKIVEDNGDKARQHFGEIKHD